MVSVILVMAGIGSRMNLNVNKVLLPLNDKPVFMHSLLNFVNRGYEVVCVINPSDEALVKKYLPEGIIIAYGGNTRSESVYNGLSKCSGNYILIHDAARPLISNDVLDNVDKSIKDNKPILVYSKVKDTIKINDSGIKTLNRDELLAAQTPQGASYRDLMYCYQMARMEGFNATDDMSLIERYIGSDITLIEGNSENIKLTTQIDYEVVKLLAKEDLI
ncbi:MAG: 2-C-methyl-D-erythritol 4-phosphate cytidylyltransferase [Acholeplasmatales bacterium]|nr:2-C-methyl-D-erythritol 4-phosphate cytidylyltransferase [Acholeplasmatales bacterium]